MGGAPWQEVHLWGQSLGFRASAPSVMIHGSPAQLSSANPHLRLPLDKTSHFVSTASLTQVQRKQQVGSCGVAHRSVPVSARLRDELRGLLDARPVLQSSCPPAPRPQAPTMCLGPALPDVSLAGEGSLSPPNIKGVGSEAQETDGVQNGWVPCGDRKAWDAGPRG